MRDGIGPKLRLLLERKPVMANVIAGQIAQTEVTERRPEVGLVPDESEILPLGVAGGGDIGVEPLVRGAGDGDLVRRLRTRASGGERARSDSRDVAVFVARGVTSGNVVTRGTFRWTTKPPPTGVPRDRNARPAPFDRSGVSPSEATGKNVPVGDPGAPSSLISHSIDS